VNARTHPRLIGAFVLGAIALVLTAVVLLSSGDWFVHRDRFAVYFPGSVKGLNRGASVTFRGVNFSGARLNGRFRASISRPGRPGWAESGRS